MTLKFNVGKREHHKAVTKLEILRAFLEEMEKARLHELNIEEVCQKIGISKVTFFNYFGSKEEVVEYFIQLWQYQMNYEIKDKGLKGAKAITYLFTDVSHHPSATSIMNALTAFFLKVDCYEPTRVSDYELYLYHEEAYLKGYRSKQLYHILQEAIGEMTLSPEREMQVMANLMTGFYGVPFILDLGFGNALESMFMQYLQTVLPKEE